MKTSQGKFSPRPNPSTSKILMSKRVQGNTIWCELNIANSALPLKITENPREFTFKFNIASNIVNETEKLRAEFVLVSLGPINKFTAKEIGHKSGLDEYAITSIEWIKPTNHQKLNQKILFTTVWINSSADTNKAICNALVTKVFLDKAQPDPWRCYSWSSTHKNLPHLDNIFCSTYIKGEIARCNMEEVSHLINTDHFLITMELNLTPKVISLPQHQNFRSTNWERFKFTLKEELCSLPDLIQWLKQLSQCLHVLH